MKQDVFKSDALADRVAVVVGASSGINLEIARAMALLSARVSIVSRSEERIAAASAGLRSEGLEVTSFAADVREYDRIAEVFAQVASRFGQLDIVVSGAAGNFVSPAHELTAKGFKTVVDIDLNGSFHVARAAFPHLVKPGSCILNISAPQATVAYPYQAHVSAAKAGVEMLTRSLAFEWGAHGVRVNAIVPGPVAETEGMRRLTPTKDSVDAISRAVPLRRYALASEIASLAVFLASDSARYITGAVIPCDGGISLAGPEAFGAARLTTA